MVIPAKEATLFEACRHGDYERIAAYVGPGNNGTVQEADARRMTLLHHAAFGGFAPVVELLLARPDVNIDAVDEMGWTPLHYAANNCNAVAALLILDAGANTAAKDEMKRTALHLAVTSSAPDDKKISCLKVLLANGCNPRIKNVAGATPFDTAKACGASEAVLAVFPQLAAAAAPE